MDGDYNFMHDGHGHDGKPSTLKKGSNIDWNQYWLEVMFVFDWATIEQKWQDNAGEKAKLLAKMEEDEEKGSMPLSPRAKKIQLEQNVQMFIARLRGAGLIVKLSEDVNALYVRVGASVGRIEEEAERIKFRKAIAAEYLQAIRDKSVAALLEEQQEIEDGKAKAYRKDEQYVHI